MLLCAVSSKRFPNKIQVGFRKLQEDNAFERVLSIVLFNLEQTVICSPKEKMAKG